MASETVDQIIALWKGLTDDEQKRLLKRLKPRDTFDGVYQRGRIWWITYTVNGRQVQESSGSTSKQVAIDLRALRRRERDNATLGLAKPVRWTVKDAVEAFMGSPAANDKRSRTRDLWCSRQLVAEFGSLRLTDIDRARLDAYRNKRIAEGVSKSTINRAIALLSRVLRHAFDLGELPANPIRTMRGIYFGKAPDRKPTLSTEAESHLLDACPQHVRDVARFLLVTGMRLGEALALDKRHLDFAAGIARIERAKGGEGRDVRVNPQIMAELRDRLRHSTDDAPVFRDSTGKRATLHGIEQAWRVARATACKAHPETSASLSDLRIHDLRHVFAIRSIELGLTLFELSKVLGHKDPSRVTAIYGDVTPKRIAGIVADLPVSPATGPAKPEGRLIAMRGNR